MVVRVALIEAQLFAKLSSVVREDECTHKIEN
jgi:hypothetical protein